MRGLQFYYNAKLSIMSIYSQRVANSIIENLLEGVKDHIEVQHAKSCLPSSLIQQMSWMICSSIESMVPNYPVYVSLHEEKIKEVPCIGKDTLMPKQLEKESESNDLKTKTPSLDLSLSTIERKNTLKISYRNSLSLSSRGKSFVLTERGKSSKKQVENKYPESRLEKLKEDDEIEDPEIHKYRVVYEAQIKHSLEYKNLLLSHEKSFNQKLQTINSFQLEDPNNTLTYDYDGQQIKSVFVNEKIKYYQARAGIGAQKKELKEGNKTFLAPQASVVSRQKYSKEKQGTKEWKNAQMPLFPQGDVPPIRLDGFRGYQRKQYKKHFDRGYSRFIQLSTTMEVSKDRPDPTDSIFSQRKHLNDSIQLPTHGSSVVRHSRMDRKIALPKLHGRYKVLDRYQQH